MPKSANKAQILNAGLDLMYRQGYCASGIQEIADASGVPKGSFYNHFDSKEAFVIEAIAQYTQNMRALLQAALVDAEGSPLARLRGMFERWSAEFQARGACGCFSGNLSQELANHSPKVQLALRTSFNTLESYYVRCLEAARAAGELADDVDPQSLGHFIYNSWQGALVRAKAEDNVRPLERFITTVFGRVLA